MHTPMIPSSRFRILAVFALAAACVTSARGSNVRRKEAPPGIESRAVKVGAPAPALSLRGAGGTRFVLQEALARGPAVLVFFRGDW